jgi:hypothetical protein
MKSFLALIVVVIAAAHASPAQAQKKAAGPRKTSVGEMLIALEKRTWELYKNKDVKALTELTPDDFYDIYSDGTVVHKERWLRDMLGVDVKDSRLSDFKVIMLPQDAAVVVYTAVAHGTQNGKEVSIHNAMTSCWAKRDGRWLNVFYRENPIPEAKD